MRKTTYAAGALSLAAALAFAAPAQAGGWHHHDHDPAKLSVLHGVPDLVVDVWVNGALTLDNFEPGDLAGPLELEGGDYEIAITAADATSADNPAIGPVTVELDDGGNYTAVAHLDADGAPTATLFANDTRAPRNDNKGKLTVRHVAAAPAVDVLAGGTAVIEGLSNPDEATLKLKAGTVSASVAAAGTTAPVIGPADITVEAGKNTIVYAWGSLAEGNLDIAVQVVESENRGKGRH
ncbi:MAG: lipoprotein [Pseudarthrobacter sp.]|nr:lipoprotein [Pseudarthrobacter sp.]